MKKIFSILLIMMFSLTLIGCTEEEPTPTTEPVVDCDVTPEHADCEEIILDVTEITVTSEARNIFEVGDDVPDFTTWFEIENSILGTIEVTNELIMTTAVTDSDRFSEAGTYQVIVTYIDSDNATYSEIVTVIVNERTVSTEEWKVENYMETTLGFQSGGDSNMQITYEFEGDIPTLVVDVRKATDTDWHTLIGYTGLEFEVGNTYTYTFTAKTEVENGRDMGVSFENSNHARLSFDVFSLTSEYQTFTGSFSSTGTSSGNVLNFFLGDITNDELGKIIFSEIRIVESTTIITGTDNEGLEVWTPVDLTDMETYVFNLMQNMTIEEKIGQMIQAERQYVSPTDIKNYNLGSVLNGGGSIPGDNIEDWYQMYLLFQLGAEESSSGIPIIFGTDSVHGNNNLLNSTIFPHNIGLGAANDPDLMRRIGEVVAVETRLTGISWTFAPAVSIAQDVRWGRTYESLSENAALVSSLTGPYIEGLQAFGVSATAKHYLGDGGTIGGTDQGDVQLSEAELRALHLQPYYDAIEAEVDTIMASYNSIYGDKMHGNYYWLQTVLKDEMGFEGFVIGDWEAVHQLPGSFYDQVVSSVNAGVDMLMEPDDWKDAYNHILTAYNNGDITEARINDAVERILKIKYKNGLFTEDIFRYKPEMHASDANLAVAREAVRKSLVLLQNNNNSLPLQKTEKIFITGPGADDLGLLLGGWSLGWQGAVDPNDPLDTGFARYRKDARVTTIYDGFYEALLGETGELVGSIEEADTVIVVLAETPYAEYYGDDSSLDIINGRNAHPGNALAISQAQTAKAQGKNVVGILLSGRPLLIEDILVHFDSFVAAWLPGSEAGHGIADVLLGDYDFTGKSAFVWHRDSSTFGENSNSIDYDPNDYLFPYGHGLTYND